ISPPEVRTTVVRSAPPESAFVSMLAQRSEPRDAPPSQIPEHAAISMRRSEVASCSGVKCSVVRHDDVRRVLCRSRMTTRPRNSAGAERSAGEGPNAQKHRIEYAGSVHDEREIEAIVGVLRGGPQALRIGKHVREFERAVAALFGKRRGVMCNSGSSA